MEKYRLKNGSTVLFSKNSSKSVAVEVMFKSGSNNESSEVRGISHFLEHMLFEGTKSRKDSMAIAGEIEKYGAEFNAYTSPDRTAFFIKIISKRFEKALDILSDMVSNPLFDAKKIEKEKKVVLKEINMITDDPKQHQWVLFQKTLFERHPAKNPTYGSIKTVKGLSRKIIMDYYTRHYTPCNMVISVVGNVSNVKEKVEKYFGSIPFGKTRQRGFVKEPLQKKIRKAVEKRKILNSYMVLGCKTINRVHKDSYVFDVVSAILGRPQSGWIFNEIRNRHGLAYQAAVQNESEKDYGYFAVFAGLDKKNIEKAKEIILQQFRKLLEVGKKELMEAKTYIEGSHALEMEDNFHLADEMAFWEIIKDASLAKDYLSRIRKVTLKDVKRVAEKYLNEKYTLAVIEQK